MENTLFDQGDIRKTYLKLASPVVIGMVITIVYNITDTFFIARTQNVDLVAGVSLCGPVFTILMAFGNIFGQGGSSLLSRLLGQGDTENVKRVSSFSFYFSLLFGVAAGLLMLLLETPILTALGCDPQTFGHARDYYRVLAIGAPFVVENFIHMNLLRCEGKSLEAMVGTVSGAVINIILDPILISGMNMGARGAAIASVLGYIFSDLYLLYIAVRKSQILSVNPGYIRISRQHLGQIFAVGTSAAVNNWMTSLCLIATNHFLLTYGNNKIAAMGIAQKISSIILLVIVGFSYGGAPLIGYFYGAGNKTRLRELLHFMFLFTGGLAAGMTLIILALAGPALRLFMQDPAVIAEGTIMLRLQVLTMVLAAILLVIQVYFQAAGKAGRAMVLSLSRQGLIFLAVIFIFSSLFGYMGVLWSQAGADVISVCLALWLFRQE